MTQQKKMSVFELLLFLSQNRRSIMLPMPLLRNMQMALQHINHVSGATMLDIMMRPHRYQLTEQRWCRCGCCKKARCPAVQSVFCLCDILDCICQLTATSFIMITSLLLLWLLHFPPGYCTVGLWAHTVPRVWLQALLLSTDCSLLSVIQV